MASHITLHACALLRKTSVQNNADFLRVNERITVDVDVATVGSFLNAFLTAQVRKDSAVMPGQELYLICSSECVTVYAPTSSWPLRHMKLRSEDIVQIAPEYMRYTNAVEHQIFKLPRPLVNGRTFLVSPEEMGYEFMEDVDAWLSSVRCLSYAKYKVMLKGTKASTGVGKKIVMRMEKMCTLFSILGGEKFHTCLNYTLEFEKDLSEVRRKLKEMADEHDKDDTSFGPDFDPSELIIPDPCPSMYYVERAMVMAIRGAHFQLQTVPGLPLCIATEPSGELGIGRWVEGVRDVHGAVSFLVDAAAITDKDSESYGQMLQKHFAAYGLVPKQCADSSSSMPGLKSNLNIPEVLLLLWEYELKTPFTEELCCIIKELFGKGNRMGFMCWVRKWKAANGIPCGKYPTIAWLQMGTFVESIKDRELPKELAEYKLKSPEELTAELQRINAALPPGAKKRKQVNQDPCGPYAIGGTQTATQTASQVLKPLRDALKQLPLHRNDEQAANVATTLDALHDTRCLDDDDFDTVPDVDSMHEEELRALIKRLLEHPALRGGGGVAMPVDGGAVPQAPLPLTFKEQQYEQVRAALSACQTPEQVEKVEAYVKGMQFVQELAREAAPQPAVL